MLGKRGCFNNKANFDVTRRAIKTLALIKTTKLRKTRCLSYREDSSECVYSPIERPQSFRIVYSLIYVVNAGPLSARSTPCAPFVGAEAMYENDSRNSKRTSDASRPALPSSDKNAAVSPSIVLINVGVSSLSTSAIKRFFPVEPARARFHANRRHSNRYRGKLHEPAFAESPS